MLRSRGKHAARPWGNRSIGYGRHGTLSTGVLVIGTGGSGLPYSLGATSIAIFTFMLFFLYPRFASGGIFRGRRPEGLGTDSLAA